MSRSAEDEGNPLDGQARRIDKGQLRILHISDLHHSGALSAGQSVIVSEMVRDAGQLGEEEPIDIVVFTGDLAAKGKAEELEAAKKDVLEPLLEALSLPPERLVLVPGNHDVDISRIDELLEPGLGQLGDSEAVNKVLGNLPHRAAALARLETWRQFRADYYESCGEEQRPTDVSPIASVHLLDVDGLAVGIALLDSAWRATGAPNDGDRLRLLIGEVQARAALDAISGCRVQIAAFHHPLEWLAPWNHELVREMLERRRLIVMTGHEHVPNPTTEKSVRGEAVYSRAGCLYGSRDYSNGYAVLDLDLRTDQVTMELQSWFPHRNVFDSAVDRVEGGRFIVSLPNKAVADLVPRPAYPAVTSALASMAYSQSLLSALTPEREPTTVDEVLVAPQFYPAPFEQVAAAVGLSSALSGKKSNIKRLNVPRLLDNQRVVVVTGKAEAGVTCALCWVLDQRYGTDLTHVPVRAKYETRPGPDPFENLIRRAARDTGLVLGPRDTPPPLVVAIDDVRPGSGRGLERLASHISKHQANLYVLGCHGDDHRAVSEALEAAGVEFTVAHLGPFGRQQTRSLLAVMGLDAVLDHMDRIFEVAFGENLPRTPFVLAALVAVLVAEPEAHPPNVSSLLDAVIDLLLRKTEPGYVDAGLDFRRREHLLEFLAAHLVKTGVLGLARADSEHLFSDYFEKRGFERSISAGNVLNSLLKSHILVETMDGVAFSHLSLRHVLAAKFMMEDTSFADQVLGNPLDYVHGEVIRHAAALRRTDRGLLKLVGEATEPALARAISQLPSVFDSLKLLQPAQFDPAVLEQDLKNSAPKPREQVERERDAYYEGKELVASVPNDLVLAPSTMDTWHCAWLLSSVLAGSELVDDSDLKTELLKRATTVWGALAEDIGAQTADWEPLRFVLDEILPPELHKDREEAWQFLLRLISVVAVGALVGGILNSPGLSAAVRRLARDDEVQASPKASLYVTILFSTLRLTGYVEELKQTMARHRQHPVVADMLRMQAIQKCLSPETPDSEAKKLIEIVADHTVSEASGPGAVVRRSEERSRVLERLHKERLRHRGDPLGGNLVENVLGIEEPGP